MNSDLPQGVCKVRVTRAVTPLFFAFVLSLSLSEISPRSRPTARRRRFNLSFLCLAVGLAAGGLGLQVEVYGQLLRGYTFKENKML